METADRFKDQGWYELASRLFDATTRPAAVRVLVVDDHVLFAEMLTLALEVSGNFEVVGHAGDGRDAVQQAAWLRPDVVIMDIEMPVLDGIASTPRVLASAPGAKVVVVSSSDSPDDHRRAIEAGAVAFLGKQASTDDLVRALERVVFQVIPLRPGLRPEMRPTNHQCPERRLGAHLES
jgi:two-component system, NarL family, response regulator LiaR